MKQTGQFKIIKNGSSVNFEHQVTFIFTKEDKTNFTRSTNDKGAWHFDVPNGEYFISAFLTQSEEKKTEQFRGGLLFVVNAQTKVTALNDWINGNADGKDPLYEQWLKLMQDTQKAAEEAKQIQQEMQNNSIGNANGKWIKEGGFGVGGTNVSITSGNVFGIVKAGFYRQQDSDIYPTAVNNNMILHGYSATRMSGILQMPIANRAWLFNSASQSFDEILSTLITMVDSNGFIKKASPIIKLFDDRIEHNDQFKEEPEFEKIDIGTYKISNTLGLAKEGTYEKPRGGDGNPYFRIVVEKLEDGCIVSVHDEYESIEKAEIIDAEGNKRIINKVVKILGQKRDIKPHERWIDLRFHEQIYTPVTNRMAIDINVPYHPLWGIEPYIPPVAEPIEEDIALKDQRAF